MTSEEFLTVREVARRCHRSEETVRRWIWSGKLPAKKLGNQLFVSSDQINRLGYDDTKSARRLHTKEQLLRQLEEDRELSLEMLAKYGPIDVAGLVRQIREED